jgi:hypothetical protein
MFPHRRIHQSTHILGAPSTTSCAAAGSGPARATAAWPGASTAAPTTGCWWPRCRCG